MRSFMKLQWCNSITTDRYMAEVNEDRSPVGLCYTSLWAALSSCKLIFSSREYNTRFSLHSLYDFSLRVSDDTEIMETILGNKERNCLPYRNPEVGDSTS